MCHGIHSQYIDEMKDCLTFRTARENKERAIAKRQKELEAMKTSKKQTKQAVAQRSMRPTRASRGHQYVPASEPKLSETFKMKKFTEIDHCTIDDKW